MLRRLYYTDFDRKKQNKREWGSKTQLKRLDVSLPQLDLDPINHDPGILKDLLVPDGHILQHISMRTYTM